MSVTQSVVVETSRNQSVSVVMSDSVVVDVPSMIIVVVTSRVTPSVKLVVMSPSITVEITVLTEVLGVTIVTVEVVSGNLVRVTVFV